MKSRPVEINGYVELENYLEKYLIPRLEVNERTKSIIEVAFRLVYDQACDEGHERGIEYG